MSIFKYHFSLNYKTKKTRKNKYDEYPVIKARLVYYYYVFYYFVFKMQIKFLKLQIK